VHFLVERNFDSRSRSVQKILSAQVSNYAKNEGAD